MKAALGTRRNATHSRKATKFGVACAAWGCAIHKAMSTTRPNEHRPSQPSGPEFHYR